MKSLFASMKPAALFMSVAAVMISGASCGNSSDDASSPKSYFISKVYPQMSPTCATCHATGNRGAPIFLADNADGSYNAISATPGFIAPPTQSPLIQKGLHSGPALTDVQSAVITEWLQKEPMGGMGDNSKPANLRAAFKLFGQCMDYTEWKTLGLDRIPESQSSSGACNSCHSTGMASVWLNQNDPDETFRKMSQFPYVQRLVTGNVDEKGHFNGIVDAERLIVKGKEKPRNGNHHPSFDLGAGLQAQGGQPAPTPLEVQDNLHTFVSDTINKMYRINGCVGATKPDGGADGG
ncbi:MAG: hypothetical protein ABIP39_01395 [Polyangiaceae bacterium]